MGGSRQGGQRLLHRLPAADSPRRALGSRPRGRQARLSRRRSPNMQPHRRRTDRRPHHAGDKSAPAALSRGCGSHRAALPVGAEGKRRLGDEAVELGHEARLERLTDSRAQASIDKGREQSDDRKLASTREEGRLSPGRAKSRARSTTPGGRKGVPMRRCALLCASALTLGFLLASPAGADPSGPNVQDNVTYTCNGKEVVMNGGTLTNASHQAFVVGSKSIFVIQSAVVSTPEGETVVFFDTAPGIRNRITCAATVDNFTLTLQGFFTPRT